MARALSDHTATLLADGRVLVVGGFGTDLRSLSTAQVYDPATGTWSETDGMGQARLSHTATLLPEGRVLVVGGVHEDTGLLAAAEAYDSSTGAWSGVASLIQARAGHTATLLSDGMVLVAGGFGADGGVLASAELYDPSTDTWLEVDSMTLVRVLHTATPLGDGRVLVIGGFGGDPTFPVELSSAEVYDPSTGSWSEVDNMQLERAYHTATLLGDGKVLVAGGVNGDSDEGLLASAELYEPSTDRWLSAGTMEYPRGGHATTLLTDGRALVTGGGSLFFGGLGESLAEAEVYDPTGHWLPLASMKQWRMNHTATLLSDGEVLVVGGEVEGHGYTGFCGPAGPAAWLLASAELYVPSSGAWLSRDPAPPEDLTSCSPSEAEEEELAAPSSVIPAPALAATAVPTPTTTSPTPPLVLERLVTDELIGQIEEPGWGGGTGKIIVSPNGRRLAYHGDSGGFVVIDGEVTPFSGRYDRTVTFSPDSARVAFNTGISVVVDGEEGSTYEAVSANDLFSPSSERVAYFAFREGLWYAVVDGEQGKGYDSIDLSLRYSPNGSRVAYVAQTLPPTPTSSPTPSPTPTPKPPQEDQPRPAAPAPGPPPASAPKPTAMFVVLDSGEEGQRYDFIPSSSVRFSPDSQRLAYSAQIGSQWVVVVDGEESSRYDWVSYPFFSPDSQRVVYGAQLNETAFAVINGVEGKRYDQVRFPEFTEVAFSPDGNRLAYGARRGDRWLVVVDGEEVGEHDALDMHSLVFSADSKRFAYSAYLGGVLVLVLDGQEIRRLQAPTRVRFSPDGKRVAFRDYVTIVVDGEEQPYKADFSRQLYFSPDSKHFAYVGSGGRSVVVDGDLRELDGRVRHRSLVFESANRLRYVVIKDLRDVYLISEELGLVPDTD